MFIKVFSVPLLTKKNPNHFYDWDFKTRRRPTLPQYVVPSALTGLTSLFEMVRGEPRCYNHLKSLCFHIALLL